MSLGFGFCVFIFVSFFIYFPSHLPQLKNHAPRLLPAIGSQSRGAPEQSAAKAGGQGRAGILLAPTGAAPGVPGSQGGSLPRGAPGKALQGEAKGSRGCGRDCGTPQLCPRPRESRSPRAAGAPAPSGAFWGRIRCFLRPFPWSTERRVSPTGCRRGPAAWTGR